MKREDRIQIIPLECGATIGPVEVLEEGRRGVVELPAYAFLLRHPSRGIAVFDTGLPSELHGGRILDLFDIDVPAGQGLTDQLAAHDVDASHIERVVLSHAHLDHVAGLPLLPNAQILINRDEYAAARDDTPALHLGHDRKLIDGVHDLFGDGSAEIIPTPGHSCGHQSVRVRRGDVYDVLACDACYFCGTLAGEGGRQPHAHDQELYFRSLSLLQDMERRGSFIVPGHDASFLDRIPAESTIVRPATPYWRAA
jgi:glyoxylase-like metal-dependent hydrolase (beta-lactamase superfamily II)